MKRSIVTAACVLLASLFCAVNVRAAQPLPQSLVSPGPGGVLFGMFVNNRSRSSDLNRNSDLNDLERQIGRRAVLSLHFQGFRKDFPAEAEQDDLRNGRIPIESWNCGDSNASIASGRDDDVIRARADAIKAYGHPIFLRYMWEMNLPRTANGRASCYDASTDLPNGRFSPSQFIAAWNHIHQIFAQEGATNVLWLWCPSKQSNLLQYYPGAGVVDWVGFDAYNRHGEPFAEVFRAPYDAVSNLGKPIMIGETAAQPATQRDFFRSAVSTLKTQFPLIKAFVYFSAPGVVGHWNVSELDDFNAMVNDPYFSVKP